MKDHPLEEDNIVDIYHEKHDVVYEMRAIVDGEVVLTYTSDIGFDDLTGYASPGDEAIYEIAQLESTEWPKKAMWS